MPSPSLHSNYNYFNTTTTKSAPCISLTSFSVRFLLQFNGTIQSSLVPYNTLHEIPAPFTPDAM